jgi:uncharacterized membrane protein
VKRVPLKGIELPPSSFSGWAPKVHRLLFAMFVIQWAVVWTRLWLPHPVFGDARWPDGLLLVLTTATLLASLARQLPAQNVMLASAVIAGVAGGVAALGVLTGIPFGPFSYTEAMGPTLFDPLPWPVPLIWLVVLLAARGVARLVLRPWRKLPNYGYWLLGLTALLAVLLDVALEPFATQVKVLWKWAPTRLTLDWYTAPGVNFLGWGVTALLVLAFATPALINKRPIKQPPPDYHPLVLWLLLNVLFATGAAANHLWLAVGFISAASVAMTLLAVYGARVQE